MSLQMFPFKSRYLLNDISNTPKLLYFLILTDCNERALASLMYSKKLGVL